MKLRQKLAVVLASAMVMSAVPVVTMAASTNSLSKETLKVKKDCEFTDISTANALKVKFTDTNNSQEIFYLDLDNAKWDKDVLNYVASNDSQFNLNADGVTWDYTWTANGNTYNINYMRQNEKTMMITVTGSGTLSQSDVIQIPIIAKAKDGDAKVSVVSMGGSTTVSNGTFIFATTAEKKMSVTTKDDKTFYTEGNLSDITIDEAYKGSLAGGAAFRIELDDTDYQFVTGNGTIEGKYGFSLSKTALTFVSTEPTSAVTVPTAWINSKDSAQIIIYLPTVSGAATQGQYILSGLKVKSTNKKPETGDFLVDIKSVDDSLVAEKSNVKIATVAEYSVYIKMTDDKAKDIKGGRVEELAFEVGENVEDSMISGRTFEMTFKDKDDKAVAHFDYKGLVKSASEDSITVAGTSIYGLTSAQVADLKDANGDWKSGSNDAYKKAATKIDPQWLAAKIMDNDGDWKSGTSEAEFDVDSDGKAIAETIIFTLGKDDKYNATTPSKNDSIQTNEENDKIKFKVKACVPVSNKDKEKATLTISGRGIENETSTQAINIINPFNVTSEEAVLKTGLQAQVSGKLTITETDKDMFQKGKLTVKVKKDNEYFGIYLTDADIVVSDGLKGTKDDITKGNASSTASMNLTLNRVSKEAATLTFENMKFTTDRTVPEGTYDLEISGTAIDSDDHSITIKDFIKITTTNTQDITANGLAKGASKFVIGESKYTFGDKEFTMDAPSYIQDPGYTMVPVRYVAQAFGVAEKDIMFGKGTVTIFAGERTISLTNGSNIAVVNGNSVAMGTAVVIKEGRTYAPASQIASLLGIKSEWDPATKTATFTNN